MLISLHRVRGLAGKGFVLVVLLSSEAMARGLVAAIILVSPEPKPLLTTAPAGVSVTEADPMSRRTSAENATLESLDVSHCLQISRCADDIADGYG